MPNRREKIIDLLFMIEDSADTTMVELWHLLEPRFEAVVERFYAHPAIVDMFAMVGAPLSDDLKRRQAMHWQRVFTLRTNEHYRDYCNHVAQAHRVIGLPASLYVAAYRLLTTIIMAEIAIAEPLTSSREERFREALVGAVMKDVALTLAAYETQEID